MLNHNVKTKFACLILALLLCQLRAEAQNELNQTTSQVTIYVEGVRNVDMDVTLELGNITFVSDTDSVTASIDQKIIRSTKLSNRQIIIAEVYLPIGNYTSLKLSLKDVISYAGKAKIKPYFDTTGFEVPVNLNLLSDYSPVIFLQWYPTVNEYQNEYYKPIFKQIKHSIPPIGSLAFVTNTGSDNITVIDSYQHRVVDVIKVQHQPTDLVYSELNQELYVINSGSNSISIVDINSRKEVRSVLLNYGETPTRVLLAENESELYVLNENSSSISIFDLNSYDEINSINVDSEPISFELDKATGDIYISSSYNDYIQIFNKSSQLDLGTLPLNFLPADIEINYDPKQLFIAEQSINRLSVYKVNEGSFVYIVSLCGPVSDLVFDQNSLKLYALMRECNEVSIIDPISEIEIETIELDFKPTRITLDNQNKFLLITAGEENQISIINKNNYKISKTIMVGKNPYKAILP